MPQISPRLGSARSPRCGGVWLQVGRRGAGGGGGYAEVLGEVALSLALAPSLALSVNARAAEFMQ